MGGLDIMLAYFKIKSVAEPDYGLIGQNQLIIVLGENLLITIQPHGNILNVFYLNHKYETYRNQKSKRS